MTVNLNGKTAVVTGGSGFIGRAIAKTLCKNGANVVIADLNDWDGDGVHFIKCDVTNSDNVKSTVDEVATQFGGIDILINNAGINSPADKRKNINEYDDDMWNKIMNVDIMGVYYFTKFASAYMVERGCGKIVNIASVAGTVALRKQSAFVTAKGGIIAFTRAAAIELAPSKINVNCVAPGSISNADFKNAALNESLISHIPMGRQGKPEEIADLVAFLSAPESDYITGALINVDGGWTCGFMRDW